MKILIRDERGVRALEEGYASEAEMQEYLRDHSDLIPVDEIAIGTPPLLCIGWEVGVTSGSQDLLYVDATGLLTVVETKLKRNPESRREVVGQVLEYGAQMCTWSRADLERKANEFLSSDICPVEYRGKTFAEALQLFIRKPGPSDPEGFSYDDFLDAIEENLQEGRIRLVIAIDELSIALVRTVEFVNRFSKHFEMYLLQLKKFTDTAVSYDVFVPAIFGRVAEPPPPPRQWSYDTFFEQASRQAHPDIVDVMRRLHDFAEREGAIVWGRGRSRATLRYVVAVPDGGQVTLFTVYGDGAIEIDFSTLAKHTSEAVVQRYRECLRQVRAIPEDILSTTTWKSFNAGLLASADALGSLEEAITRFAAELRAGDQ